MEYYIALQMSDPQNLDASRKDETEQKMKYIKMYNLNDSIYVKDKSRHN